MDNCFYKMCNATTDNWIIKSSGVDGKNLLNILSGTGVIEIALPSKQIKVSAHSNF